MTHHEYDGPTRWKGNNYSGHLIGPQPSHKLTDEGILTAELVERADIQHLEDVIRLATASEEEIKRLRATVFTEEMVS